MSLVSYNPVNQLDEDVLLVIFDQLDDEDLLRFISSSSNFDRPGMGSKLNGDE
jgi:hypothetical protein